MTKNQAMKAHKMYASGASLNEVGRMFGISRETVSRAFRKHGLLIRTSGESRKGKAWSKKRRLANPIKDRPLPVVVEGEIITGMRLKSHRSIGNKSTSSHGYVLIRTGYKERRYEHSIVAEKALGRRLKKNEVVHHINCNKKDNRPENLLICSVKYHLKLHARMRRHPYWRKHKDNNQEETP